MSMADLVNAYPLIPNVFAQMTDAQKEALLYFACRGNYRSVCAAAPAGLDLSVRQLRAARLVRGEEPTALGHAMVVVVENGGVGELEDLSLRPKSSWMTAGPGGPICTHAASRVANGARVL